MHKEHPKPAGLSAEERDLLDQFAAEERATVDSQAVAEMRDVPLDTASQTLVRLHSKGWLVRLRRGLYVPVALGDAGAAVSDPLVLAMELFPPCFISGWSAAEHWDLTEQIFNSVSVVTSAPQRKSVQSIGESTYRVRALPEARYFGGRDQWVGSHKVSIADASRTVVDVLDDPSFGGGGRHAVDVVRAYWRSTHASPAALLSYTKRYERGTLAKRVGYLAEQAGVVDSAWLEECRSLITKGVSDLDPAGGKRGKVVTRWNLRINVPMEARQ